ncbi:mRNA cleavage and polyadenylation factor subunit [Elasticomyces elasticus]|nr:mRNA cleavage and polyadenylation factor subunit [Elasticomyces elasticus]KAK3621545.1 mRNA cleavage and polyadenylation factor subunit [Elasticomyces elasticus]KAK4908039.1 mRNA cleavage and polyadenylation factor subunit [Elasticomyces elasticus]KAK5740477.1 mRNA cleavage and polyadenylation factor subunit [Elasticomyces elasticus]
MHVHTPLLPPTAISHSLSLPFLSATATNLLTTTCSTLDIYTILPSQKLSLIASYPLSGTPTALANIALPNTLSGGHAVLLGTRDAKISLIEWDPENWRVRTVSIHYYEGESPAAFGVGARDVESILTVDPESRCAALKFGARGLAILPFRSYGDDEVAEEGLDAEMAEPTALKRTSTHPPTTTEEVEGEKITPYSPSFTLPLTSLDPSLQHPVHLAFLHEYREPTFGILSSPNNPSLALSLEQGHGRDSLTYSVYTLDLSQRASTNLLTVSRLPADLWKVVPLPLPVGGALLLGTNEIIHVDQNGKVSAVAVNEFALRSGASGGGVGMADQSSLHLKLEGCELVPLDPKTGELLLVLNDGTLAVLGFKLAGRNVGGLTVTKVERQHGGLCHASAPSCVSALEGGGLLFIGSEDGNSSLLSWRKEAMGLSRKRSHAQMLDQPPTAVEGGEDGEEGEVEDVDEDDLYAPTAESVRRSASANLQSAVDTGAGYRFEVRDELRGLGPVNGFCLGKGEKAGTSSEKLELVAAVGRGRGSKLAFLNREIVAEEVVGTNTKGLEGVKDAWRIRVRSKDTTEEAEEAVYEEMLFVYDGEVTKPYRTNSADGTLVEVEDTDFESEGATLFMGTLGNDGIVVQARKNEVRTYDAGLGLSQIIPMTDDEGDQELGVVGTSFADPYLLVLRDDSSVVVLKVDEAGEVEPLDLEGSTLGQGRWVSGCVFAGSGELLGGPAAWLLNGDGGLQVFALPGLEMVWSAPTLPFLSPVLMSDAKERRGGKVQVTEVLVAELGVAEEGRGTYLVVRTAVDDLVLYEPFWYLPAGTTTGGSGWEGLRFRKVPSTYVPRYDEGLDSEGGERPAALRAVRVGGRRCVVIPGSRVGLIVKEVVGMPRVLGVRTGGKVRTFVEASTAEGGFGVVDKEGKVREFRLPGDASYETGWSVRFLPLSLPMDGGGEKVMEVRFVAFHEKRGVYVVAACWDVDFHMPAEEEGEGKGVVEDISLRPQVPQYSLHLLSATTHEIIQSVAMPYAETITSMKIMPLEVSEHTHEQRSMVVVGTATIRGEDLPAKGALTVLDIIDVVPDPDRPESGVKLQAVSREETKGAVTALEAFGDCGLVGTAQGQKIMLRGLKEDGSCLPVAFLDSQTYITTLRTFGRSGLWLAGDAWKGLWFGGFIEEPYKLSVLGKSRTQMEVMAAEFLPFDGLLYIVVVDAEMDLHVLQYDPEDAKTLSGQRLLHRGSFHLGDFPTPGGGMLVLPSVLAPMGEQTVVTNGDTNGHDGEKPAQPEPQRLFQVLTSFQSGAIGLLTPLDETTYRRLSALQTQLTSLLEHAGGLNPRAYRAALGSEGRGGVVDGALVQRIGELGAARRAEVLGRAGADGWTLRSDLEIIGGGGLSYL